MRTQVTWIKTGCVLALISACRPQREAIRPETPLKPLAVYLTAPVDSTETRCTPREDDLAELDIESTIPADHPFGFIDLQAAVQNTLLALPPRMLNGLKQHNVRVRIVDASTSPCPGTGPRVCWLEKLGDLRLIVAPVDASMMIEEVATQETLQTLADLLANFPYLFRDEEDDPAGDNLRALLQEASHDSYRSILQPRLRVQSDAGSLEMQFASFSLAFFEHACSASWRSFQKKDTPQLYTTMQQLFTYLGTPPDFDSLQLSGVRLPVDPLAAKNTQLKVEVKPIERHSFEELVDLDQSPTKIAGDLPEKSDEGNIVFKKVKVAGFLPICCVTDEKTYGVFTPQNFKTKLLGDTKPDPLVIMIHGTFAPHTILAEINGAKSWVNPESDFAQNIRTLWKRGDGSSSEPEVIAFQWSGIESREARAQAGEKLAETVKYLKNNGIENIRFVTHSHGGNVALHAMEYLKNDADVVKQLHMTAKPNRNGEVAGGLGVLRTSPNTLIATYSSHADQVQVIGSEVTNIFSPRKLHPVFKSSKKHAIKAATHVNNTPFNITKWSDVYYEISTPKSSKLGHSDMHEDAVQRIILNLGAA